MTLLQKSIFVFLAATLAACEQQAATPKPVEPSAEAKAAIANATDDEKRQSLASLTISQCILKDLSENTFRNTLEGSTGYEFLGKSQTNVDIHIDRKARMMVRLSDDTCHVLFDSQDLDGTKNFAEPAIAFGTDQQPVYNLDQRGEYVSNFVRSDGQAFLSIVRRDQLPNDPEDSAISIFLLKR